MKRTFLLLTLLGLILGNAWQVNNVQAETKTFDVEKLSEKGRIAYESLLKAVEFQEGYIGYAAEPSVYIENFNILLREPAADEAFKSLLREATKAGQLYALCGIYFTDYEFFQKQVEKYKKIDDLVLTRSGCIGFSEKVSKIVESDKKNVAIINPKQTIEDWWKANKGSYELDIAHGGYPASFKRFANLKKRNDK